MAESRSNKKVANSLVAMSSAAVLAVYTAGFVRTRPVANRLTYESFMERAAPQQTEHDVDIPSAASSALPPPSQPNGRPAAARVTAVPSAASKVNRPAPSAVAQTAATQAAPSEPAATVPAPVSATSTAPAPATAEAKAEPAASVASAPAAQTTATAASDPAGPAAPAVATAPAAQATPPAPAPRVWKDGKYTAWGTCQHGDIQATVVIEGGRIISAEITNCQTRYSCDVIENLPAKVITRQKAKFDTVGGATESAYAYYGAVYWALDQASK
ncbi:MAG TPA: hypothetical protein VMH05_05575 [Bryobacteraceae bacterium]|nr:hypothetical protein [Bryobacteraceae bacterium]